MKKTGFIFCLIAIVLASCSKDQRISRRLDGSWDCTMNENAIISPQTKFEYHFTKEKNKRGKGYYVIAYTGYYGETHFTYEVNDEQLTLKFNDTTSTVYNVAEYNKNKIVLMNAANSKTTNLRAK